MGDDAVRWEIVNKWAIRVVSPEPMYEITIPDDWTQAQINMLIAAIENNNAGETSENDLVGLGYPDGSVSWPKPTGDDRGT